MRCVLSIKLTGAHSLRFRVRDSDDYDAKPPARRLCTPILTRSRSRRGATTHRTGIASRPIKHAPRGPQASKNDPPCLAGADTALHNGTTPG